MHTYLLSLGSNLGKRLPTLRQAVRELGRRGEILALSSVWETSPLEMKGNPPLFLNCALKLKTYLPPRALLSLCKQLEEQAGRNLEERYQSRPLDIDIITWSGGEWRDEALLIPHPKAALRKFVIIPANEISETPWPIPNEPQTVELYCGPDTLMP